MVTTKQAITMDYYDYNQYNETVVALKISFDENVLLADGVSTQEYQELKNYFEQVLSLLGKKATQNDTDSEENQSNIPASNNELVFTINNPPKAKIELASRQFRAFVIDYQYTIASFVDDFHNTYNHLSVEQDTPTNTTLDLATILKRGYHQDGNTILPLSLALPNTTKAIDNAALNLLIARRWTLHKTQTQQIINGTRYAKFTTNLSTSYHQWTAKTQRANPIGYSILVISIGLSTVIVLKLATTKNKSTIIN